MNFFPRLTLAASVYDPNQDCGVIFGGFVAGVLSNSLFLISDHGEEVHEIQVKGIL